MRTIRSVMAKGGAGIALAMLVAGSALAQQAFPVKPIRVVIAFGPGSGSDLVARILAEELRPGLGQPIVVDNKPGGSAQIAAEIVAKAPPDGYTLFLTTNTAHSANPYLFRKLNYDPLRDFTSIARVLYVPYVLAVEQSSKFNTVREVVDAARANPGKLSIGYGNSTSQVASAAFAKLAEIDVTPVGYKSMPAVVTDVLGGRVEFVFIDMTSGQSYLKSGKLKPIAFTLASRSTLLPSVPTVAETPGFAGFDVISWIGLVGPANLPRPIVDRLAVEMQKVLGRADIREKFAGMGAEVAPSGPAEMEKFVRDQLESWRVRIRDAGIQPE
jgi:tripartite-type tricarboxylate transporter receptor subunit TctC